MVTRSPRLDAELFEDVGEPADFAMQILVAQHAAIARLAFPDDGGLVFPPRLEVPIEAVVRRVDLAADEPLGVGHRAVEHLVPLAEPVQVGGHFAPEAGRVVLGAVPQPVVFVFALDVGLARQIPREEERRAIPAGR